MTFAFPLAPVLFGLALLWPAASEAQINIITNHYDSGRTGANLSETVLTTSNVNQTQFGKLYSYPVDGAVYAQPLYVSGVTINNVLHNVLYVATMNDKVYAFDADSNAPTPLWFRDFTGPGVTAVPVTDIVPANLNIIGNVGIESTPVIDAAGGTIYLVARTKESTTYVQTLHALDIATGAERSSPVTISASVTGNAPDATDGAVVFNPKMENQRAGLALTNGVVLIAWASHEDAVPYHGWVMAYDAGSLAQVGVSCLTLDAYYGGIWQSGRAPVLDASGNAYFVTGNGIWDGTRNFGDSVVKFRVSAAGLSLVDYFTPGNWATLNVNDTDLGSTGAMLIPNTSVLVAGGKGGVLYLVNAGNLGHETANDTQVIQALSEVNGGQMKGGPAFWNSATAGPLVYYWAQSDALKAFHFNGTKLDTLPYAVGTAASPGSPGGALSVSANANQSGSGVVWASLATSQNGNHGLVAGVLRAYNAETLQELWNSEQNSVRDRIGTLVKFVPPVVMNGKVYQPNYDGAVVVYGLLPPPAPDFSIGASVPVKDTPPGGSVAYTVNIGALNGFAGTVTLSASSLPDGVTASFDPAAVTGAGNATMTVTTPASMPLGTATLFVNGTSGVLSHSAPLTLLVELTPPLLSAVSIDFVGTGTAMAATETAGVVAKSHWNSAAGTSRNTPLALVSETGAATGAGVTWASDNLWSTSITNTAGNLRMMKGYLDTNAGHATTVTVTGLATGLYDIYVYVDGDNGSATRTGTYQLSGAGITTTPVSLTNPPNTNFAATFTPASNGNGNYVKFSGVVAAGFTLTATPGTASDGVTRAPINGLQIVPAAPLVPDFTLAATPGSQSVNPGASTSYTATVAAVSGFSGLVNLSVTGLPANTSASLSSSTVMGAGSVTLTVTSTSSTPVGSSTLTISGTSGTLTHSTTVTLAVNTRQTISVDFVGTGTAMAATETAGVVAKSHWNSAAGTSRSAPLALVNETGAATGAGITWASDNLWSTSITNTAGNLRMMKGYLDTNAGHATTVTVTGLAAGAYDIYVYVDGDNGSATRTGTYQLSGTGITTTTIGVTDPANTNFAATFTPASNGNGNYVKFSGIAATGFTLTATPGTATDTVKRAPVNGLQIIPN